MIVKPSFLIFTLLVSSFCFSQKEQDKEVVVSFDSTVHKGYTNYRLVEENRKNGLKHGPHKIYSYCSLTPEKKDSIIRQYRNGKLVQLNTYYSSSSNSETHYRKRDQKVKSVHRYDVNGNLTYHKKMGLFRNGKEYLYHPGGKLAQKTRLKRKTERVGCALVEKEIIKPTKVVLYDEDGKKIKKGKSPKVHLI